MKSIIDLTYFKPDDNFEWEDYVKLSNKITSIDQSNINNELEIHSAIYSYYAGILHKIKRELDLQQCTLDKLGADIRSTFFAQYKVLNGAKPTEKIIESEVIRNSDVQNLKKVIIDLEYKYNLFKGLSYGLEHRKDCLIQLSSNKRAEIKLYD